MNSPSLLFHSHNFLFFAIHSILWGAFPCHSRHLSAVQRITSLHSASGPESFIWQILSFLYEAVNIQPPSWDHLPFCKPVLLLQSLLQTEWSQLIHLLCIWKLLLTSDQPFWCCDSPPAYHIPFWRYRYAYCNPTKVNPHFFFWMFLISPSRPHVRTQSFGTSKLQAQKLSALHTPQSHSISQTPDALFPRVCIKLLAKVRNAHRDHLCHKSLWLLWIQILSFKLPVLAVSPLYASTKSSTDMKRRNSQLECTAVEQEERGNYGLRLELDVNGGMMNEGAKWDQTLTVWGTGKVMGKQDNHRMAWVGRDLKDHETPNPHAVCRAANLHV